jgi:cobalt-zinc-cadmium efflux system outer membrane protein
MNAPCTWRLTLAVVLALALGHARPATAQTPATQAASRASSLDSLLAASAMSPDQLERAVLERNPTLAAANAAFREASARADRAGALMNPMVDVMVAPRVLGNDEFMAPGYVVDFRQNFPIFGERGLEGRAARAEARAMGEEARGMRLDLLRESRRLYYEYYLAERGLVVNQELKTLLDQFRSAALQKYAAGVVGREDALQAEVELAMLDHQAVVLGRDRRIIRARVNALLHRSPGEPLPAPLDSLPIARPGDEAPAAADLPLNRPDVRSVEAEREAGEAMLALAKRRWLPEITLLARYDAMEHEHEMRPMVGAGLSLPLWLGRTSAGVREASAGLERKTQERLARIDRARFEIEEARARVEETRHEIHIVETGVIPATERALTSIRSGYEANRSDFLALLNAERDLARARLDGHRARAMYRMALADWEFAIARDDTGSEVTR